MVVVVISAWTEADGTRLQVFDHWDVGGQDSAGMVVLGSVSLQVEEGCNHANELFRNGIILQTLSESKEVTGTFAHEVGSNLLVDTGNHDLQFEHILISIWESSQLSYLRWNYPPGQVEQLVADSLDHC